jgi:SAM-dependent methyltransferase
MERLLAATARAEDTHFWFLGLRRVAQQLLAAANRPRRLSRIIDCGAGTGRNLEWLARHGQAVGIELEPTGVRLAHRLGRAVVRGTVVQLPFAPGTADLVTSFDVLICLDDDEERRALREMWTVLKPGGLAIVNVAALAILRGAHSALSREVRRYSKQDLAGRLTAAGFAVERLTYTNLSLFPAALAVRGVQRLTGRTEPSERDLQVPAWPVNSVFNLALRLESVWLRRFNLPIGTSLIAVARKPPASGPDPR